ncbi:MAG: hypothetical protein KKG59_03325 [Nanoarchaeota archaeon]|nr:hypothetical protein [Nanoarchaeota archaeon]
MQDKTLLRFAIGGCIFGILLLFVFSQAIHLPDSSISELEEMKPGDKVIIKAEVIMASNRGGTTILDLGQECTIKAVVFDQVDLKSGSMVRVGGTLQEYKGEMEIIVDKIQFVDND